MCQFLQDTGYLGSGYVYIYILLLWLLLLYLTNRSLKPWLIGDWLITILLTSFWLGWCFKSPLKGNRKPSVLWSKLRPFCSSQRILFVSAWVFWGESLLLGVCSTVGEVKAAKPQKQRLLYISYTNMLICLKMFHIYSPKNKQQQRYNNPEDFPSELKPLKKWWERKTSRLYGLHRILAHPGRGNCWLPNKSFPPKETTETWQNGGLEVWCSRFMFGFHEFMFAQHGSNKANIW